MSSMSSKENPRIYGQYLNIKLKFFDYNENIRLSRDNSIIRRIFDYEQYFKISGWKILSENIRL